MIVRSSKVKIWILLAVCGISILPFSPIWQDLPLGYAGEIMGSIIYQGHIPPRKEFMVTRDREFCGESREMAPILIHPTTNGVKDVVISLKGLQEGFPQAQLSEITLRNHDCEFVPHISAALASNILEIRNDDPILHNTHIGLDGNTFINIALVPNGDPIKKPLKAPGVMFVECNAHPFMQGYILAFDHPFFSISDETGNFHISGIPPGEHHLSFWHEYLGTLDMKVVVPETGSLELQVEYPHE